VRCGVSDLVLVFGDAGVGKTRFVDRFIDGVDDAFLLQGRCIASGQARSRTARSSRRPGCWSATNGERRRMPPRRWTSPRGSGHRRWRGEILDFSRRRRISVGHSALTATPPAPFGLPHREREVLSLVAEGRTNGEVGAALFITTKTASVHVSNILAKLGVANRGEAAAVAHRLGIPTP
jgi:DNA-binding CsgD family transcriptional regulator